jgi:hypothetical protein
VVPHLTFAKSFYKAAFGTTSIYPGIAGVHHLAALQLLTGFQAGEELFAGKALLESSKALNNACNFVTSAIARKHFTILFFPLTHLSLPAE